MAETNRFGMKRTLFTVFVLLIAALLLLPQTALAHSPSDMQILYDPASQQLTVTILHQVPDPATHYIKEVILKKNGQQVSATAYTNQPSFEQFTYRYPFSAGGGDMIEVYAPCVLGGSVTRSMNVGGDRYPDDTGLTGNSIPPPTQSAPAPLFLLLLALFIVKGRVHPLTWFL